MMVSLTAFINMFFCILATMYTYTLIKLKSYIDLTTFRKKIMASTSSGNSTLFYVKRLKIKGLIAASIWICLATFFLNISLFNKKKLEPASSFAFDCKNKLIVSPTFKTELSHSYELILETTNVKNIESLCVLRTTYCKKSNTSPLRIELKVYKSGVLEETKLIASKFAASSLENTSVDFGNIKFQRNIPYSLEIRPLDCPANIERLNPTIIVSIPAIDQKGSYISYIFYIFAACLAYAFGVLKLYKYSRR